MSSLTEAPEVDVTDLIDTLTNRVGGRRLYRFAPVASDVPERCVTRVGPTAPDTGEGFRATGRGRHVCSEPGAD